VLERGRELELSFVVSFSNNDKTERQKDTQGKEVLLCHHKHQKLLDHGHTKHGDEHGTKPKNIAVRLFSLWKRCSISWGGSPSEKDEMPQIFTPPGVHFLFFEQRQGSLPNTGLTPVDPVYSTAVDSGGRIQEKELPGQGKQRNPH